MPATELEVTALVYAVEHFKVYLLGSDFTVLHRSQVTGYYISFPYENPAKRVTRKMVSEST